MKLVFRPLVEGDLDEATRWYEERQPGFREIFLARVRWRSSPLERGGAILDERAAETAE